MKPKKYGLGFRVARAEALQTLNPKPEPQTPNPKPEALSLKP